MKKSLLVYVTFLKPIGIVFEFLGAAFAFLSKDTNPWLIIVLCVLGIIATLGGIYFARTQKQEEKSQILRPDGGVYTKERPLLKSKGMRMLNWSGLLFTAFLVMAIYFTYKNNTVKPINPIELKERIFDAGDLFLIDSNWINYANPEELDDSTIRAVAGLIQDGDVQNIISMNGDECVFSALIRPKKDALLTSVYAEVTYIDSTPKAQCYRGGRSWNKSVHVIDLSSVNTHEKGKFEVKSIYEMDGSTLNMQPRMIKANECDTLVIRFISDKPGIYEISAFSDFLIDQNKLTLPLFESKRWLMVEPKNIH